MDEGPGNDDSILSWLASSNPILVPQAGLDIGLEKGQARALWFSREIKIGLVIIKQLP
jgi:hypothetical protein